MTYRPRGEKKTNQKKKKTKQKLLKKLNIELSLKTAGTAKVIEIENYFISIDANRGFRLDCRLA